MILQAIFLLTAAISNAQYILPPEEVEPVPVEALHDAIEVIYPIDVLRMV